MVVQDLLRHHLRLHCHLRVNEAKLRSSYGPLLDRGAADCPVIPWPVRAGSYVGDADLFDWWSIYGGRLLGHDGR